MSLDLVANLQPEDQALQSAPFASPTKWHLAHTTWFFETFLLKPFLPNYQIYHPEFPYFFNSYYGGEGKVHPRAERGFLSRPLLEEVLNYRAHVEEKLCDLLHLDHPEKTTILHRLELGLHHEQQHQELIVMDIKYNFFQNPIYPAYAIPFLEERGEASPRSWLRFCEELKEFGAPLNNGFAFDNECPQHRAFVPSFEISSHLVTNAEYLEFIEAGGYDRSEYWLADGWSWVATNKIKAPLYWTQDRSHFGLFGNHPLNEDEPVCHLSYYEANAYANFRGLRLPTEYEWELAAKTKKLRDSRLFLEGKFFHPRVAQKGDQNQFHGNLWEWTASAYCPYPGFKKFEGAIGEYNGKFMCNQMVLRGGSFATPQDHYRVTYRNFFYPHERWMFCGLRLARDVL